MFRIFSIRYVNAGAAIGHQDVRRQYYLDDVSFRRGDERRWYCGMLAFG